MKDMEIKTKFTDVLSIKIMRIESVTFCNPKLAILCDYDYQSLFFCGIEDLTANLVHSLVMMLTIMEDGYIAILRDVNS
jgi:hypothetical protein